MIKKIIITVIFMTVVTACSTNDEEASQAKQDLLTPSNEVSQEITGDEGIGSEMLTEEDVTNVSNDPIDTAELIGAGLLEFDPISASNLAMGKVTISGVADSSIDKIVVSFHNDESDMEDDSHTLSEYTKTKPNFRYNAYPEFDVFDFGTNIYTFTAYGSDGLVLAQTRISIDYSGNDTSFPVDISDDVNLEQVRFDEDNISLPNSATYGEPVVTSGNISYSNIDNFEIRSYADVSKFSCDNATDVLMNMNLGYFYWNTCRSLTSNVNSVYVVQKIGDSDYAYYKYYFNVDKGLIASLLLENGELALATENSDMIDNNEEIDQNSNSDDSTSSSTQDQISNALRQKNEELKQKNSTYSASQITDSLMKNID